MKETGRQESASVLEIGNRLELFVDGQVVEKLKGASLRLHAPVPMPRPRSPLTGAYMTVIRDGGLFRAWYRRYRAGFEGPRTDGNRGECTCCAESPDGHEWEEPDHGILGGGDSGLPPNAVLDEAPFAHNLSPFLDARPGVPEDERYKALAGTRGSGLHAFASPDGLRWRKMAPGPVISWNPEIHGPHCFDSQNVSFWSAAEGCFVAYFRHWKTPAGKLRTVGRATSPDFISWRDESGSFRTPNFEGEELYTSQAHHYFRAPHIYIALPSRFTRGFADRGPVEGNFGSTDIMLMTGRAGADHFDRLFPEAFIRPGPDPAGWANRANYPALNIVPTGPAEMSLYNRDGRRYALRTDGFVSVNAACSGGELVTKPLVFEGSDLVLNLSTSLRGEVRVEMQDEAGRALEGFSLEECRPLVTDGIAETVSWASGAAPGRHAGRAVRLRFAMRDADLYSFRFR